MKIIAFIVTLLACCLMFYVKREWKAALLVMGAMVLTTVSIPGVPFHKANYLLPVAFLLSEWKHWSRHFRALRRIPQLTGMLLLIGISALIAALTSPYIEPREFLQEELLFKYLALAYAFWAVKDERSLKPVLRISWYCVIVLTVFGVLNYMTKSADFVNALTEGRTSLVYQDVDLGSIYTESNRFRVQSMFVSSFDYGFICVVMLLLHWYGWLRELENKMIFALAAVCCLFGVITCECRIVWVCCILSVSCFYVWCYPLRKSVLAAILVITAFIVSYSTVKVVEEKVDKVTDIFKENSNTAGSSIDMRMFQLAMTLYQIEGEELFGLGQKYWAATFAKDPSLLAGLYGIESVVFQLLLERGIFGFAIWIVFWHWLFRFFWKRRQSMTLQTGLGVSVWTCYLFFAIGTGELGSVYPTLLLLGMMIRICSTVPRKTAVRKVKGNYSREKEYVRLHIATASNPDAVPVKGVFANPWPKENTCKRLAIVIPAYKAAFLPAALDSIAAQTCKDFTVYVGDDCSPEPIGSIVERYRDKTALVYHRFDSNLGGKDLVAQWERCIAMSQNEPYIWLFSDDDVMEPNCVEALLKQIEATKGAYDLYHFDVKEINEKGEVNKSLPEYPQVLGAYDYYKGKSSEKYRSYVVENVFSRTVYEQTGGFKKFDLAWGSDVATWCIFCGEKGMCKISSAHVLWRRSSLNLTPNKSIQIAERKLKAECEFLNWAYTYFRNQNDIWEVNRALFISKMHQYKKHVGKDCFKEAFTFFFQTHGHKHERLIVFLLVHLHHKLYHFVKPLL